MQDYFDKKNKNWLLNSLPNLTEVEKQIIAVTFDAETDVDEMEIAKDLKEASFYRKLSLYEMLMFVPSYVILRIIFDKKYAEISKTKTKLFSQYYFKKIDFVTFKEKFRLLIKGNAIGV